MRRSYSIGWIVRERPVERTSTALGWSTYNHAEQNRCHDRFVKIDANHDAYITLEEIQDFYHRLALQAGSTGEMVTSLWLSGWRCPKTIRKGWIRE